MRSPDKLGMTLLLEPAILQREPWGDPSTALRMTHWDDGSSCYSGKLAVDDNSRQVWDDNTGRMKFRWEAAVSC